MAAAQLRRQELGAMFKQLQSIIHAEYHGAGMRRLFDLPPRQPKGEGLFLEFLKSPEKR